MYKIHANFATKATPTVIKITLKIIAAKIPMSKTLEVCCSFTLKESNIKMKTKILSILKLHSIK